jgi:hypothetical protein
MEKKVLLKMTWKKRRETFGGLNSNQYLYPEKKADSTILETN